MTDSKRNAFWGLALCVTAAITYSAVNACLRKLTIDCDRVFVIFVKELVTVVVVGPWLAWHAWRGRRLLPTRKVLLALALAGLLTQLGGNLPNIWAFSVIGLAVALPVMSGTNMVATAVLGRIFLGERVSQQIIFAIGLLLVSVALLSLGAPRANKAIAATAAVATGLGWTALAVAVACFVGCVYAILVVTIRRNVTAQTPPSAVVFVITGMGVVTLGPWLAVHHGPELISAIPPDDLGLVVLAGVLNLLAFLAITKGLQWTPAASANMIMTSQVAMGAMIGMTLFAEPASPWMVLGVCLTIVGMILIGRQIQPEPETPETPI